MLLLTAQQAAALRPRFAEVAGSRTAALVGLHVLNTGNGACFADRWPDPRVLLADAAGNYALHGDPNALDPAHLADRLMGFVAAPEAFERLLVEAVRSVARWDRVILTRPATGAMAPPAVVPVRRLDAADAPAVWGLTPGIAWISKTWGGPPGLAASGTAWGAFDGNRLVSVACVFFLGDRYADIGVVTEPGFRGRGLSVACAGALCDDIAASGRLPSWTTSPENAASLRVAEKLGFTVERRDVLFAVGVPIPAPA